MKKLFFFSLALCLVFLAACGGAGTEGTAPAATAEKTEPASTGVLTAPGADLTEACRVFRAWAEEGAPEKAGTHEVVILDSEEAFAPYKEAFSRHDLKEISDLIGTGYLALCAVHTVDPTLDVVFENAVREESRILITLSVIPQEAPQEEIVEFGSFAYLIVFLDQETRDGAPVSFTVNQTV